MRRFYCHLIGPDGCSEDVTGSEFGSFELAYLDVRQAIIEMSAGMLTAREDPSSLAFEIRDETGQRLAIVPFWEVLAPAAEPRGIDAREVLYSRALAHVKRGQALHDEVRTQIAAVQGSILALRETLKAFDAFSGR